MLKHIAFVLLLPNSVAFAQQTSGAVTPVPGPSKVYYRKEVFSYQPNMTYSVIGTPPTTVQQHKRIDYSLSIGDIDQYKNFYRDEFNNEQYDIFNEEDTAVDFIANITSGTAYPVSSNYLTNKTYKLDYTIIAGPVEAATMFVDTFKPTNQANSVPLARDATTSLDIIRIYIEVTP